MVTFLIMFMQRLLVLTDKGRFVWTH